VRDKTPAHPERGKTSPCIPISSCEPLSDEAIKQQRYNETMELFICAVDAGMEEEEEAFSAGDKCALEKIDGVCRRKEMRLTRPEQEAMDALQEYHDEQGHPSAVELLKRYNSTSEKERPAKLRTLRYKSLRWLVGKLTCAACDTGAQRAAPKSKRTLVDVMERKKRAEQSTTLHLCADLCGPHTPELHNVGGAGALHMEERLINKDNRWTLVVVEENTLVGYTAHFDEKGDAKQHLKAAVAWYQSVMRKKVVEIIVDNGTEFKGKLTADMTMPIYLLENGIHMRPTIAHEKVKNSLAERFIDIVVTKARVLIHRARLPTWLHAYAVNYAMHMLNHAPRTSAGGVAPVHYMPNASSIEKQRDLIMFGERVTAYNNNKSDRANKFAPVSAHAIYLGIDRPTGAHVMLVPTSGELTRPYLVTSINVRRTHRFYYSYYSHELAFAPRFGANLPTAEEEIQRRGSRLRHQPSLPHREERAEAPAPPRAASATPTQTVEPVDPAVAASPLRSLSSENGVKVKDVPATNERRAEEKEKEKKQGASAPQRKIIIQKQPVRSSARNANKRVDYSQTKSKAPPKGKYIMKEVFDDVEVAFPDNGGKVAFTDKKGVFHYEMESVRPSPTRPGYMRVKWVDYDGEYDVPISDIDPAIVAENSVREDEDDHQPIQKDETGRHLNEDGTLNVFSVLWEGKSVAMIRQEVFRAAAEQGDRKEPVEQARLAASISNMISSIMLREKESGTLKGEEFVTYLDPDRMKYKRGSKLPYGPTFSVAALEEYRESGKRSARIQWEKNGVQPAKESIEEFEFTMTTEKEVTVSAIVKTKDGTDTVIMEPTTVRQMLGHVMYKQCMEACEKEYAALVENATWRLVRASTLPPNTRPIKCKWVWKFKVNADGGIDKVKARLCARGDMQREGIDYDETFAATVKTKTIKVAALLAIVYGLDLRQIDYTNAFLNGYVKERIFMEQVPLFLIPPEKGEDRPGVLQLVKSLYGIKQAPRVWNKMIDAFMMRMNFTPLTADPGMYVRLSRSGKPIIITLYVDDKMIMVAPEDREEWGEIEKEIAATFRITSEEKCEWILRVSLQHDGKRGVLSLSQQRYVEEMLTTYRDLITRWGSNRRINNPAGIHQLVSTGERVKEDERGQRRKERQAPASRSTLEYKEEKEEAKASSVEDERVLTAEEQKQYQSVVGSLMYAGNITRIDICFQVNALARYMAAARGQHMRAAVRVLQYLQETKTHCT
jgi:hypothetical protein